MELAVSWLVLLRYMLSALMKLPKYTGNGEGISAAIHCYALHEETSIWPGCRRVIEKKVDDEQC